MALYSNCQPFPNVQGNDNGPQQALWESALDVKPLMTAEDHAFIGTSRAAKGLEARRIDLNQTDFRSYLINHTTTQRMPRSSKSRRRTP